MLNEKCRVRLLSLVRDDAPGSHTLMATPLPFLWCRATAGNGPGPQAMRLPRIVALEATRPTVVTLRGCASRATGGFGLDRPPVRLKIATARQEPITTTAATASQRRR